MLYRELPPEPKMITRYGFQVVWLDDTGTACEVETFDCPVKAEALRKQWEAEAGAMLDANEIDELPVIAIREVAIEEPFDRHDAPDFHGKDD